SRVCVRSACRDTSSRARDARRSVSGLPALVAAAITVLAAAYLPGFAAVRLLGGSRWLALALAPALGAAVAGTAAIAAALVGLRWLLVPFLHGTAVLLVVRLGLRGLDGAAPDRAAARHRPGRSARPAPHGPLRRSLGRRGSGCGHRPDRLPGGSCRCGPGALGHPVPPLGAAADPGDRDRLQPGPGLGVQLGR